jgi:hypothetical protein
MKVYLGVNNTDNADDQYRSVRMVQAVLNSKAKENDSKWDIETCFDKGSKYSVQKSGGLLIGKSIQTDYDMLIIINNTFAELKENV